MKRNLPPWVKLRPVDPSEIRRRAFKTPLDLACRACGHVAPYEVGTVNMMPEERGQGSAFDELEARVGFSGYFRCASCGSAGPWNFPPRTATHIAQLLHRFLRGEADVPLFPGKVVLFDGTPIRSAAEGEDRLKVMIQAEPENGHLWRRLGNLLKNAGRLDLARPPFERAVELDTEDLESHCSLGVILYQEGDLDGSARHLHQVVRLAPRRKDLEPAMLRRLVRGTLETLFEIHEQSGCRIRVFPEVSPEEIAGDPSDEHVLILENLDLSSDASWDKLVGTVLGERRSRDPGGRAGGRNEADFLRPSTPMRNHPCPCGSGSKYKNCCGR